MKIFQILFLVIPLISSGQSLKNNYYFNSAARFSIKFDKDWNVKIPESGANPIFAAKSKHQIISLSLVRLTSNYQPKYTQEEANQTKHGYAEGLKARKVIIHQISSKPGVFQGKKCMITIAQITETNFNDNVPVYHKLIQFLHKGNMFSLIYNIPLSNLSELESMERQIKTMKFF